MGLITNPELQNEFDIAGYGGKSNIAAPNFRHRITLPSLGKWRFDLIGTVNSDAVYPETSSLSRPTDIQVRPNN